MKTLLIVLLLIAGHYTYSQTDMARTYAAYGIHLSEGIKNEELKLERGVYYFMGYGDPVPLSELLKKDSIVDYFGPFSCNCNPLLQELQYTVNLKYLLLGGGKYGDPEFKDLSVLKNLKNLEELVLIELGTTDLRPLKYLPSLKKLELRYIAPESLNGLQYLKNLEELRITHDLKGKLSDISPLVQCPRLKSLTLSNNSISDVRSLQGLPYLKRVDLSNNEIKDPRPLLKLKNADIYLEGNPVNKGLLNEEERERLGVK